MITGTSLKAAAALNVGHPTQATLLESTSATTTYHRTTVDGVGVFYREAGPKDAPTIVLLHGFPSSSREFDTLIPLLATRYHLIAPDFPGFGQSDAPPPSSYVVVWGRNDPSFIAPGAEAFRRDLPDSEIHLLDAGHFALDEKDDDIATSCSRVLGQTFRLMVKRTGQGRPHSGGSPKHRRRHRMRWTMMDLLFVGVGWTDLAITLNRIAVGAFFMLSGYHKLFNAERHRSIVDELKALGVPAVGFNQWWVPLVEFTAGGAVLIGLLAPLAALGLLVIILVAMATSGRQRIETLQADR